jgi:hypothetical protein
MLIVISTIQNLKRFVNCGIYSLVQFSCQYARNLKLNCILSHSQICDGWVSTSLRQNSKIKNMHIFVETELATLPARSAYCGEPLAFLEILQYAFFEHLQDETLRSRSFIVTSRCAALTSGRMGNCSLKNFHITAFTVDKRIN